MAVYKRSYQTYEGALTPRWSRFLILARYSWNAIFKSRISTGLFLMAFFYPLICLAGIYVNHNAAILKAAGLRTDRILDINGMFFFILMSAQGGMAFLITALIGPGTVAPDLANNALPLYFCRPLTRTEYIAGRGAALFGLLSLVTWAPGLVLFAAETNFSGLAWAFEHWRFAAGVFIGSLCWITVLTLMALAFSAWVRWRLIAGALLLAVQFAASGVAAAINGVLRVTSGFYLDPKSLVMVIWARFFDVKDFPDVPTAGAVMALGAMCVLFIAMLARKIRAFEVVR
jgi:ABC-2 type transport system permease protein